jgi:hypothetical protein
MWSLCKVNGVPVLCLFGSLWWEGGEERRGDYGDRCAPLSLSLYLPNEAMQPVLHQGLCWLQDAAGFYVGAEPSHPDVQASEQVRHIYRSALKRAREEVARTLRVEQ